MDPSPFVGVLASDETVVKAPNDRRVEHTSRPLFRLTDSIQYFTGKHCLARGGY